MDILTQGLLGGVLAQAIAKPEQRMVASVTGFLAGLAADADVLISSSADPLLNLEYHRHFSHSLFFIPFGALLVSLLLWPLTRKHIPARRLFIYSLAGYSLSGVLDACTSYGTLLFWPFSDERVAWSVISIIDPIFTLILITGLLWGLRRKQRNIALVSITLAVCYIVVGVWQHQRVEALANELAVSRGHEPVGLLVKPTLGNLVLWRSIYLHDGNFYVDAIRAGLPGGTKVFPASPVRKFDLNRDMALLNKDTVLYKDIQRFIRFSSDYVAYDESRPDVLGDIRYSMLPNSTKPLWGIRIDPVRSDKHIEYRFFRNNSSEVRDAFFDLLFDR